MEGARYAMIRLALGTISRLGLDRALGPRTRGAGAVLTFHRVTLDRAPILPENAGLQITPAFLDRVLNLLTALGYEIIALDALKARLENPQARPFVVLTFDDGYRDTRDIALPVLKAHDAPFTTFICNGFAEGSAPLWWLDLEEVAQKAEVLSVVLADGPFSAPCATLAQKRAALRALYWRLRALNEHHLREGVARLCTEYAVDRAARTRALCMDWDELAAFAKEPLVTIGAHTMTHPRLGTLTREEATHELRASRDELEDRLGRDIKHFCYPVGDSVAATAREAVLAREAGFETAFTTRPGVLKPGMNLHALPRISVNGMFQNPRYLRALISGVPFIRN